jgi:Uncharacterized conserved protein
MIHTISSLEQAFNFYVPGIVLHAYEILNSHLLQKRSKTQRITSISIDQRICVSKEEETSEVYKEFIIDQCLEGLKQHMGLVFKINPSGLPSINAYFQILNETSTNAYFKHKLAQLCKSFKFKL